VEEADEFLQTFRGMRLATDFVWKFELKYIPSSGNEVIYEGIYYGSWYFDTPISRITLLPNQHLAKQIEFIFHNGIDPRIWKIEDETISEVPQDQWTEELVPGSIYRPFDILLPYVFWQDYKYLGPDKQKSRPVQKFQMLKPEGSPAIWPDSIEMNIDDDYFVMIGSEVNKNGKAIRRFRITGYENVQQNWILESTEIINFENNDKTELTVKEAAMNIHLPEAMFNPYFWNEPLPKLTPEAFSKL
jgi:hypothetical protein